VMYLWEMLVVSSRWLRMGVSAGHGRGVRLGNDWYGSMKTTEKPGFYIVTCRRKGFKEIVTVVERALPKGGLVCSGCGTRRNMQLYLSPSDHFWYCRKCSGARKVGDVRATSPKKLKKLVRKMIFVRAREQEWIDVQKPWREFFATRPELIPEFMKPFKETDPKFYEKSMKDIKALYQASLRVTFRKNAKGLVKLTKGEERWVLDRLRDRIGLKKDIGVTEVRKAYPGVDPLPVQPLRTELYGEMIRKEQEDTSAEQSKFPGGA
jgi:hypothetical protein